MGFLTVLLLSIFGISAVLLIVLILLQDEQSEGLGGLFGGGASNQVGNRKGNILTKTTTVLGFIFIVVAFTVAWINHSSNDTTGIEKAAQAKQGQTSSVEWWKTNEAAANTSSAASVSPDASASPAVSASPAASADASASPAASLNPAATDKPSAKPAASPATTKK
jgi:preprotein translocase subunit SecG